MTGNEKYTVANTHSHNDYEQSNPFWMAWQAQFGSIDADIWLVNGTLLVGHNREEIKSGRTLEEYYVKPLASCIQRNNGHPYADTIRQLQILIDVKADSVAALNALISLLDKYPVLESTPSVKWVISGNRPSPDLYTTYPAFITFDGELHRQYSSAALSKISMMSDNLHFYSHWLGTVPMPAADKKAILDAVNQAHELHLPVRFWEAPDTPAAWDQLMQLHVDFINTDHIRELATYLNGL
jgi:alkaline phosphatase